MTLEYVLKSLLLLLNPRSHLFLERRRENSAMSPAVMSLTAVLITVSVHRCNVKDRALMTLGKDHKK